MSTERSVGKNILIGLVIFFGILLVTYWVITEVVYLSFSVPTESMQETVMAGDWILADRCSYDEGELPERGTVIIVRYPGSRDVAKPLKEEFYLERCVAVAGDLLEVRNHHVYIDGDKETFPTRGRIAGTDQPEHSSVLARTFPRGKRFGVRHWGPMRIPKKGDVIQLNDLNVVEWETFIQREGHEIRHDGTGVYIDGKAAPSYVVERNYVFGMGDNRNNSLDSRFWGLIPVEDVVGIPFLVYWSWEGRDEMGNEYPFLKKLGHIRWERIGEDIR